VTLDRVEAWTDLGEMPEDVFEHSRLMAAMNLIMTEGARSEGSLRQTLMRDVGDLAVLRRIRMM
jgi:hypothetical protein